MSFWKPAAVLALVALLLVGGADAKRKQRMADVVVSPGGLQAALNAANPGDRILLNPGTYSESISMTRPGTSAARITIARNTTTPTITGKWVIRSPYVTARQLIFDGAAYNDYPIWVASATGHAGTSFGSYFILEYSEVKNSQNSGIFIGDSDTGQTPNAMPVYGVTIRNNYIHNNGNHATQDHGVYIKSGTGHLVQGNLILSNSAWGVHNYPHAQSVAIRGNEIRSNGAGGLVIEWDTGDPEPKVSGTVVDGNYFKSNTGRGIQISYAGDVSTCPAGISNTITNNWAEGNTVGQYGNDGELGNSDYTRCAVWSGNVYGSPRR